MFPLGRVELDRDTRDEYTSPPPSHRQLLRLHFVLVALRQRLHLNHVQVNDMIAAVWIDGPRTI